MQSTHIYFFNFSILLSSYTHEYNSLTDALVYMYSELRELTIMLHHIMLFCLQIMMNC